MSETSAVAAVILAAGRSERMGRPKALLSIGGETFVGRLVRVAREAGLGPVEVVVGEHRDAIAAAHPELVPLLIPNDRPDLGQLHSLRLGLAALGDAVDALVAMPVDHALVRPETVSALLAAYREAGCAIAVPVHAGRRGHPVLFARSVFAELAAGPLAEGARAVVRSSPARVREVIVEDPGVLRDIDTPEEYREAVGDERAG